MVGNTIDHLTKKYINRILLFVRIIQYQSGNSEDVLTTYKIKNTDHEYYLDIPTDILLERYYTRFCNGIDGRYSNQQMKAYWKRLSKNNGHVMGSNAILQQDSRNRRITQKLNYKFVSYEKLFSELSKIIR